MAGFITFITVAFIIVMASGHPHDESLKREERYIRDGHSGSQGHTGYPRNQEGLGGGHNQGGYNQGGHHHGGYQQGGHHQGSYPQGGQHHGGYPQGGHNQGHGNNHGGHGYQTHGY